jgi:hypothetical protein
MAMGSKKKSWQEKLMDAKGHPTISVITPKMQQLWGTGRFVIPASIEVDDIMRGVRKGHLLTIDGIRSKLCVVSNIKLMWLVPSQLASLRGSLRMRLVKKNRRERSVSRRIGEF